VCAGSGEWARIEYRERACLGDLEGKGPESFDPANPDN